MQAEEVMINHTFDDIERAPPEDHLANESHTGIRCEAAMSFTPEHEHTNERNHERCHVEQSVPEHVSRHGIHRMRRQHGRSHVVPLQDLVKSDAINEPTQSYT